MIRTSCSYMVLAILICVVSGRAEGANRVDEALKAEASWSAPSAASVKSWVDEWLQSTKTVLDEQQRLQLDDLWNTPPETAGELQATLVASASLLQPRAADLVEFCRRPHPASEIPEVYFLDIAELPDWGRRALRLHFGSWLASQHLYDEAHEQLEGLSADEVADPASLLFFQATSNYRRLEKNAALAKLSKLLEAEDSIPRRYAAVGKLMLADLEPLKPDSLNEISRMMDNITVRLDHGRAGQRVRKEEDDVIEKLDKLIKKLEDEANKSNSSANMSGGGSSPSSPMQQSMNSELKGPGNVDPKKLGAETDWGNLPPKQREEALQELGKDLPSHYRAVIEEYFRKLAKDGQ